MARATTKSAAAKTVPKKAAAKTATRTSTAKATKAAQGKAASSKAAPGKAASGKAAAKGALAKVPAKPARGASKVTAAGAVLTLRHIAEAIALGHELAKRQANELMAQVVEIITRRLKKGDKIRLSGLGILQVKKRAARMGRNPATGEAIKIKASKKIAFRPAKELKDSI